MIINKLSIVINVYTVITSGRNICWFPGNIGAPGNIIMM